MNLVATKEDGDGGRRQSGTKTRILDAAERLFADDGFHSTSLRGLTAKARVNLAAVNYHFASKEALLQAVLERRLVPLNKAQWNRLEKVRKNAQAASVRPSVRGALHAFFGPMISLRDSDPAAEDFIRLLGRSLGEQSETIRGTLLRHIGPVQILLFDILAEALPHMSHDCLFWRLNFALGSMIHAMSMCHFPALLPNTAPPISSATMTKCMLDFIAAGMEAPCAQYPSPD
ncbi:MAG: TetR/AcrR family transcriptional regulator [Trichloromonadaceae bacterium]